MRRFLDGELVADRSRPVDAPPELWPCDDGYRFFLIMNLAVGRWFDEPRAS